jgi:hypothetical protein
VVDVHLHGLNANGLQILGIHSTDNALGAIGQEGRELDLAVRELELV